MSYTLQAFRPATSLGRLFRASSRPVLVAYAVALVIFFVATLLAPNFDSMNNVSNMLLLTSFAGLAALGQTFVVLGGGLDLSIPWVMTGSAIVISRLADGDDSRLLWAVPLVLSMSAMAGLVNGIGVTKLRVSPIVMTLGLSGVIQGGVLLYTQGQGSPAAPPAIVGLARNGVGPFTYITIMWLILAVAATVVLARAAYGRRLYATGANPVVARLSGIRTSLVVISTYVVSGLTASLAGMLLLAYTATPFLSMGNPYLFTSIAAVAVGGTSILGGQGSYVGTVAGALVITLLGAFLPILGLSQAALPIIYGVVILVAVAAASGRLSRSAV